MNSASPYPCLFAFGMAGASINFSTGRSFSWMRSGVSWTVLAAVLAVGLALMFVIQRGFIRSHMLMGDLIVGLAVACVVIACACSVSGAANKRAHPLATLLALRPLIVLGSFSYSLYLIHYPIIGAMFVLLRLIHLSPIAHARITFVTAVPAALMLSYVFYRFFERPFLNKPVRVTTPDSGPDPAKGPTRPGHERP
jgi:peptidoglycan/LPS O-acetylase OafA/YrhL